MSSSSGTSTGPKKESGTLQLVLFALAGSEFGVEITQVREIIRMTDMTKMPKAPRFMEGIINLRGQIIPVLDLRKRFDMPVTEATSESRIMITEVKGQSVGLLVDKISEVLKISGSSISTAPDMILTIAGEYLLGVVEIKSRLVLLLNLERIFNLEEIKALAEIETALTEEGKASGH
jgi:purine-binding chemotaxis protein CheW